MAYYKDMTTPLCKDPDWASQLAVYVAPPVLVVTAALYLIAAVMDYMEDADYKVVYIAGAALWVIGQLLIAVAFPVIRSHECSQSVFPLASTDTSE